MRYFPLTGIDVQASRLCLGVMNHGTTTPEETGHRLLDEFLAGGGNFVDTANNYAFWNPGGVGDESELSLGRWITSRSARDRIVLAGKVGARPRPGLTGLENIQGLSGAAVIEQVEGSLRRLGTDHLDLLYAHIDDHTVPVEETLGAFTTLIGQGKVRAVGASNLRPERLSAALRTSAERELAAYTALQLRFSYLPARDDADFSESMQISLQDGHRAYGLPIMVYAALLAGAYTRADRPVPSQYRTGIEDSALAVVRKLAEKYGVTANHIVYAWLLASGLVPLVGASGEQQLQDAFEAEALRLEAEDVALLDSARSSAPH